MPSPDLTITAVAQRAEIRPFYGEKRFSVDALIRRAEGMKQMLDVVSRCACPTLDACADALAARTPVMS